MKKEDKKEIKLVKETEPQEKKFLSSDDLRYLIESFLQDRIKSLEIRVEEVNIDRAEKERTLLSANYTLKTKELQEIQLKLGKLNQEKEELKNKHKELVKTLASKYSLPEKWGFDQDSGEIKI